MHTHKKWYKIMIFIVLIIIVLLLDSCINSTHIPVLGPTSTPAPTPTPLIDIPGITEPADVFPCQNGIWTGLRFGYSTEDQLTQWLKESSMVRDNVAALDWRQQNYGGLPMHVYDWDIWTNGQTYARITLNVVSDTLYSMWTPLLYTLTLRDIIEQLGEPAYIEVTISPQEECAYFYAFYYPLQGIEVNGVVYDEAVCQEVIGNEGPLKDGWLVDHMICGRPGRLDDFIEAMYGVPPEVATQIAGRLQPWTGFGQVILSTP